MKRLILIIVCIAACSASLLAQVTYSGTLDLRDGTRLSGTITKFTPENGYPTTFYRVDNGNETRYVSVEEVLGSDKPKVTEKIDVKEVNGDKSKSKTTRKKEKHSASREYLLPEKRTGAGAKFVFVNEIGLSLSYDIADRRHRMEFGFGWNNNPSSYHILSASASYQGYWRVFKGLHLYLGPSLGLGVAINNGAYFAMLPGINTGLSYEFNNIPLGVCLGFDPHWDIMIGSGASGFAFSMNVSVKYIF
ncbi:MAG: hypothetical protein J6T63_07500 [Bacteroidales bacterium]|nr:hypothetical protein [Bacteroidales bacterium]